MRKFVKAFVLACVLATAAFGSSTSGYVHQPKMQYVRCNFFFEGQFYIGCHHVNLGEDGSVVEILD